MDVLVDHRVRHTAAHAHTAEVEVEQHRACAAGDAERTQRLRVTAGGADGLLGEDMPQSWSPIARDRDEPCPDCATVAGGVTRTTQVNHATAAQAVEVVGALQVEAADEAADRSVAVDDEAQRVEIARAVHRLVVDVVHPDRDLARRSSLAPTAGHGQSAQQARERRADCAPASALAASHDRSEPRSGASPEAPDRKATPKALRPVPSSSRSWRRAAAQVHG